MVEAANSPEKPIDVAVFGAGAAGTYAAYRLIKEKGSQHPDIRLFERGNRIGGRLWSKRVEDLPGQPLELGGMGFSRVQQNVWGLCTQELGLETRPFSSFNNVCIQHLRGCRFMYDNYWIESAIPYRLDPSQKGKDPSTLMVEFFETAIPGLKEKYEKVTGLLMAGKYEEATDAINELVAFLREAKCADGKHPVWSKGLWNELMETANSETCMMNLYANYDISGGLNFNFYDGTLAYFLGTFAFFYPKEMPPLPNLKLPSLPEDLIEHIKSNIVAHDPVAPPFYHLTEGYQELPVSLSKRFREMGGGIEMQTQLYSIRPHPLEGGDDLLAAVVGPPNTHPNPDNRRTLYCRNVILNLPKRALELLDKDTVLFASDQFREDLHTTVGIPACKLFIVYDEPWWKNPDPGKSDEMLHGYSTTDLPLKGTYYFPRNEVNGRGLLLAALSDSQMVQFWEGYREGARWGLYDRPADSEESLEERLAAPPDMIVEAQRQLATLHGRDVPRPRGAWFINWGDNPFGGGWHSWVPNVKSWEVMPRIRKPLPDRNIFICGEAYSSQTGWVEGAINTAEMVVEDHFGVDRPAWVTRNYDFGP